MSLHPDSSFIPYLKLSLQLKQKPRKGYGTMFRHQLETFAILHEYDYTDSVLLKAALIHDIIEEVPGFNENKILNIDNEGQQVLDLVKEVSKRQNNGIDEPKERFLLRIMEKASDNARILKLADRISNVTSLYHADSVDFIKRYVLETHNCIVPFAKNINERMCAELENKLNQIEKLYNV